MAINTLLHMSLSASLLIGVILLIRWAWIGKLPKQTFVALWLVALFQLLVPVSVPSPVSIFRLVAHLEQTLSATPEPAPVHTGITFAGNAQRADFPSNNPSTAFYTQPVSSPYLASGEPAAGANLWTLLPDPWVLSALVGTLGVGLFFVTLTLKTRRVFDQSLPVPRELTAHLIPVTHCKRPITVRVSDAITTPLTYGVFRPVILMPRDTQWGNTEQLAYILTHELIHIKRLDALKKLIMTVALCLHWFNPLVWLMCRMFNRDIELACDEAVIRTLGEPSKKAYARTLLDLSQRQPQFLPLYNNFSKHPIEERINAVINMKKHKPLAPLIAFGLVASTATIFATTSNAPTAPQPVPAVASFFSGERVFDLNLNISPGEDPTGATLSENITEASDGHLQSGEAAQLIANVMYNLFGHDISNYSLDLNYRLAVEAGITMSTRRMNQARIDYSLAEVESLGLELDQMLDYLSPLFAENGGWVPEYTGTSALAQLEQPLRNISSLRHIYLAERSAPRVHQWAQELGVESEHLFDYIREWELEPLAQYASQLGVDADFFAAEVQDVWFMVYNSWPSMHSPAMWIGMVSEILPPSDEPSFQMPLAGLSINAETGELINIFFTPADMFEDVEIERVWGEVDLTGPSAEPTILPTDADNLHFATLAADTLERTGLAGDRTLDQARIHNWHHLEHQRVRESGEPAVRVAVELRFTNGDALLLGFDRDTNTLLEVSTNIFESTWLSEMLGISFDWVEL